MKPERFGDLSKKYRLNQFNEYANAFLSYQKLRIHLAPPLQLLWLDRSSADRDVDSDMGQICYLIYASFGEYGDCNLCCFVSLLSSCHDWRLHSLLNLFIPILYLQ